MFRYAVLSGVSSDSQAQDDKGSLEDQIQTARRAGEKQGGRETAGPFVIDGYSRSGYVNLSDALRDIPSLRDAVEAAERDLYDVLILDNLERLGDLAPMIATLFKKYKKQIHSARQPARIFDPSDYDPFADESADIMIHVEGIIQRYRLNKLRRGLTLGIKKRVEDGKHSTGFPYGYKKDEHGCLVLDLPVAHLLIELKDCFLRGLPLRALAEIANASGIPSRRGGLWRRSSIQRILSNPFYTGKVFNGRWKMVSQKKGASGKRAFVMKMRPDVQLQPGRHPPLWTWDEHLRMKAELDERYRLHPRRNPRNFSGLLVCSVCGVRLQFKVGKYRCCPHTDHIHLSEAEANETLGRQLAEALRQYTDQPLSDSRPDTTAGAIAAIEKKIQRIQHGFKEEIYSATEAKQEIDALRAQIQKIETGKEERERRMKSHERLLQMREKLLPKLDRLPAMLATGDKAENNRLLRDLLTAIYITPEHVATFEWR